MEGKKKCWLLAAALLMLCAVCLGGCKKKTEPVETTTEEETMTQEETTTEEATTQEATTEEETEPELENPWERQRKDGKVKSYLTGEWVDETIGDRRPIAVMFSNVKAALPQTSISKSGVIIEAPAEGGVTRLMGLIEDYDDLDKIGSVRSARTYFVLLQKEFEPIFVHYGQCNYANEYLDSENCDNLNGVKGVGNTVFYRTSDRKSPHNAYASAEGIFAGIEQMGYSLDYPEDYEGHYLFVRDGESVEMKNAAAAGKVVTGYSSGKPWFEYNKEDGLYYRYEFDAKQYDDLDGRQLSCKNIILQYCDYEHYYDTDYLYIHVQGTGSGKYITDGKAIDITWKKDGDWGVTHYYDLDGNELRLNQGKTWVCIIQTERVEKIEINE